MPPWQPPGWELAGVHSGSAATEYLPDDRRAQTRRLGRLCAHGRGRVQLPPWCSMTRGWSARHRPRPCLFHSRRRKRLTEGATGIVDRCVRQRLHHGRLPPPRISRPRPAPLTPPLDVVSGGEAFVSKLSPSGSSLVYSTYLGGNAVAAKWPTQSPSMPQAARTSPGLTSAFGTFRLHPASSTLLQRWRAGRVRKRSSPRVARESIPHTSAEVMRKMRSALPRMVRVVHMWSGGPAPRISQRRPAPLTPPLASSTRS